MAITRCLGLASGASLFELAVRVLFPPLLLLLILLLLLRRPHSSASLPPSPPSFPFLGHIFLLPRLVALSSFLRRRFGPIFTLRIGPSLSIVITSPSLAHQALVLHGSSFASRPHMPSRATFSSNFRNINASPYGPYWRAVRRNLVQEMLAPNRLLSFKPARELILDDLLRRLHDQAQNNAGVVAVYSSCYTSLFRLVTFMCFGIHMDDEAVRSLNRLIHETLPHLVPQLSDFYPLLRLLEWNKNRKRLILRQRQVGYFTSLIERHKTFRKEGKVTPGSYLESLLRMEARGETKLSTSDLVSLCAEFVLAGTAANVNCMEWTMAHLVKDPLIQDKLYKEIEGVVGNRSVEEEDLANMPYLQAVVMETLRLHPPAYVTLPYAVTTPCQLAGYDIPTTAVVSFHLACISRDPELWEKPLEYRPERFSETKVDITGTKKVTMIPFGAGRRICPGKDMALMHVQLFVARLVQKYEWRTSKPGGIVDLSEEQRFTIVMKTPLEAAIGERRCC